MSLDQEGTARKLITFSRAICLVIAVLMTISSIFSGVAASAPIKDSKGADFWVVFPSNQTFGQPQTLSLFITGDTNTTGTVEIPGLSFSATFSVTANVVTTVTIPEAAQLVGSDAVENKGIHVKTDNGIDEVTVYGLNRVQFTTDAYLGLPTDILGAEYIVLGYQNVVGGNGTEFAVVGTVDGTTVTITPSVTTGLHTGGTPYNISLNQGQTYQLINSNPAPADLSGTIITSTSPIAVFGGVMCANIPPGFDACDHIVEELPPTSAWGKSFVTMPLATRIGGDTFRFIASTNGTTVNVNGSVAATLNRGQLHEQIITGPAQITSDQPILVAQYSNGSSFDGVTSDPFMMLIPPFEQFLADYTVSTPASGFRLNFINVVAPTGTVINLDGSPISAGSFSPIDLSGFSGAQVPVTLGSHHLTSTRPFGVFVYGFDSFDSYGYPGGMALAQVAAVTGVTLAPKTATNVVGTEHCVTATVVDQNNNPLEGIRVDFSVTGPNSTSGFAVTNASGQATFCYSGTNEGTDTITASVGDLSDTAAKTWQSDGNGGGASCTLTLGYWKNHANAWPASSLTLGTVSYTKTQLLQILKQPPAGNGLVTLAHQLITAKLNKASGASVPSSAAQAIADADTLIGSKVVPPNGTGKLAPSATSRLVQILDAYNNGLTADGPRHCQ